MNSHMRFEMTAFVVKIFDKYHKRVAFCVLVTASIVAEGKFPPVRVWRSTPHWWWEFSPRFEYPRPKASRPACSPRRTASWESCSIRKRLAETAAHLQNFPIGSWNWSCCICAAPMVWTCHHLLQWEYVCSERNQRPRALANKPMAVYHLWATVNKQNCYTFVDAHTHTHTHTESQIRVTMQRKQCNRFGVASFIHRYNTFNRKYNDCFIGKRLQYFYSRDCHTSNLIHLPYSKNKPISRTSLLVRLHLTILYCCGILQLWWYPHCIVSASRMHALDSMLVTAAFSGTRKLHTALFRGLE